MFVFLSWLLAVSVPMGWTRPQEANSLSTLEQFNDEFQSVPCRNDDRQDAVKALFERMGATPSEITTETYSRVSNIVIRKPGTSEGFLVVGAHYDKADVGCGAVDNWTGIVTVAHLYRSLKDVSLNKTVVFVAFGKEEGGLIGSHAMVDAIGKQDFPAYCAMINIDSLGLAVPQVMDNTSSRNLQALTQRTAKELQIPFRHYWINGGDADSSSFLAKKVPAVTIHGLTSDWRKILHTVEDRPTSVNPQDVYLGYRLVLALIQRLDNAACDAYKH